VANPKRTIRGQFGGSFDPDAVHVSRSVSAVIQELYANRRGWDGAEQIASLRQNTSVEQSGTIVQWRLPGAVKTFLRTVFGRDL